MAPASWDAEVVEVADSGVLFGHLTDTHVVGAGLDENLHVDNNGRLAEVVASLEAEDPSVDAVLATGDLTVWGRPGDYAMLADLLAPLTVPVLAIPGNHDDRDRMRAMFPDLPWVDAPHASWVVDLQGVRVIGLDSTIPGEPGAEFDDRREAWLAGIPMSAWAPAGLHGAVRHPTGGCELLKRLLMWVAPHPSRGWTRSLRRADTGACVRGTAATCRRSSCCR